MENIYYANKKIGIWGFGIVGISIYQYLRNFSCTIQILDKKNQENSNWIEQNEQSIQEFLQHNDIIIASPGVELHNYEQYRHKFISELDIYQQTFNGLTIAITGTIGKTSITNAIAYCSPNAIAAGNIGYPMINAITKNPQPKKIILELSSFQLNYSKNFAPNIAIFTNFYANHLDHHKSEDEYFQAKCNIFRQQTSKHFSIIPCSLIQKIKNNVTLTSNVFLTCQEKCKIHSYPTFTLENDEIFLTKTNNATITIQNNLQLFPQYTYKENWLVIIAALYLQNIDIKNISKKLLSIPSQEHRFEKFATHNETTFYNDSKSTVWQSTKEAVKALCNESCILFLGGLSKGANRTPLIQYLQDKQITVFSFGKEAERIKILCEQYKISCKSFQNLETAVNECFKQNLPKNILFSPAGSSFDLFKNYQERGNVFKQLVTTQLNIKKTN